MKIDGKKQVKTCALDGNIIKGTQKTVCVNKISAKRVF